MDFIVTLQGSRSVAIFLCEDTRSERIRGQGVWLLSIPLQELLPFGSDFCSLGPFLRLVSFSAGFGILSILLVDFCHSGLISAVLVLSCSSGLFLQDPAFLSIALIELL